MLFFGTVWLLLALYIHRLVVVQVVILWCQSHISVQIIAHLSKHCCHAIRYYCSNSKALDVYYYAAAAYTVRVCDSPRCHALYFCAHCFTIIAATAALGALLDDKTLILPLLTSWYQ
jgi:hypothetical protein